jgi:UDP-N-acetylmuramate-alanine ligase
VDVDLAALARDAVDDARATAPDCDIEAHAQEPALVRGDPDQLRQVVTNLLANATDHTPEGTPVEVTLGTEAGDALLSVRDHGRGLSAAAKQQVFERFWRESESRGRESGGAGLGLAIVAAIVKAHGGRARADNHPDGGAVFTVELPLAVPGEHNRSNAAAALAALELAGVPRADAEAALVRFRGAGRRFTVVGEAGGVRVVDDYAHHPTELAATIAAARAAGGRVHVLFQPHLPSRTRHLALELGAALAQADTAVVTEIYAARETVPEGLSARTVVDAAAAVRPGMRLGWAPALEQAVRVAAAFAEPGDVVLTVGAGDVDRAGPLILEALA